MSTPNNQSKKGLVYLTRRMTFSSAHRLHHPDLDNQAVYGQCANLHGHNYTVEVTVKGVVDSTTGFVFDLKEMKNILERTVHNALDHKNLDSDDVPYFKNVSQSAENIVIYIWNQVNPELPPNVELHQVRLKETENNIVDYFG